MLKAITTLLLFQLMGETLSMALNLPIPGPVIGMALLFVALAFRGEAPASLRATAQGLLQHLSLLYVPAGVGVMLHFQLIADDWSPILAALVISTFAAIFVTAVVLRALMPKHENEDPVKHP